MTTLIVNFNISLYLSALGCERQVEVDIRV